MIMSLSKGLIICIYLFKLQKIFRQINMKILKIMKGAFCKMFFGYFEIYKEKFT